jgi:hypothetical protein
MTIVAQKKLKCMNDSTAKNIYHEGADFFRLRGYLIKIFKLTPIHKPVSNSSQRRCAALA